MDVYARAIAENARFISSEDVKKIIAGLNEMRKTAKVPDTLEKLAIDCVIQDQCRLIKQKLDSFNIPKNPFTNANISSVERLLSAVTHAPHLELNTKISLLLRILNQYVKNFDSYLELQEMSESRNKDLAAMIFRHMLQNCPNITKVKISESIWNDDILLPRIHSEDIFPLMASSWQNLQCLTAELFDNNQRTEKATNPFKTICHWLPNLWLLDITLHSKKFTMEEVNCLSKMQHLKCLCIKFFDPIDDDIMKFITHAAGLTPFLERFNLPFQSNSTCSEIFLNQYAKFYQHKKLTIQSCWLDLSKKCSWPECLSIENLGVYGQDLRYDLSSLPLIIDALHCHEVPLPVVYILLEILGTNLTHLRAKPLNMSDGHRGQSDDLDIQAIFAACPKLRHLRLDISGSISRESIDKLKEGQFKNLTYFKTFQIYNKEEDGRVIEMYTKFFLESQIEFKTYTLKNYCELSAMTRVLRTEAKTCFDKLEELKVSVNNCHTEYLLQLIGLLLQRSPFLKKLSILNGGSFRIFPVWFKRIIEGLGVSLIDHQTKKSWRLVEEIKSTCPSQVNTNTMTEKVREKLDKWEALANQTREDE